MSNAIDITYLVPGYFVSDSFLFDFETPAIAFDANQNLYTVDKRHFGGDPLNTIDILKLDAATGYSTSSVYAIYSGFGISGLEFDDQGDLYIAEFIRVDGFLDQGRISRIDTSLTQSTIADLPDYRPTGITLDADGTIYFPGRRESEPTVGSIYTIDPAVGIPVVLVSGFVGTGIAIDDCDNIFASTPFREDVLGQEARVIYMFDSGSLARSEFARSVPTVEELTFDWEGIYLYVLEVTDFTPGGINPPEMITISPEMVDIKPGCDPNSINCRNEKGVITVAILTMDDFDATTVDHKTVTFEGGSETHVDQISGELRRHEEDVDDDGDIDLVFHFRLGETDLTCDSTQGTLTGLTFEGQSIEGTDNIRMVGG